MAGSPREPPARCPANNRLFGENMKPPLADLITFPRACAGIFSIGGTFWAIVVGLAMLVSLTSLKTAIVTTLYFLPGWVVYFGWMTIAKGSRPEPLSDRIFWLISGIVSLAYFGYEFQPWRWLNESPRSLNIVAYWWLFTGFLSLICFLLNKEARNRNAGNQCSAPDL